MLLGISLAESVGCSQFKRLSAADRLSRAEQYEYLVLRSLAPPTAADYLNQPTAEDRARLADWFWAYWTNTTPGHRIDRSVYLERAATAARFFGTLDLTGDERIPVYIQHGAPRREVFEPRSSAGETAVVFTRQAEIWTYPDIGRQFDFVRYGTAFRLVGESRFGSSARPPALEPVDLGRPAPKPVTGAGDLKAELSMARFGQHRESVTVEVYFGLRSRRDTPREPLHVAVAINGTDRNNHGFAEWMLPVFYDSAIDDEAVVGRRVLQLPPDDYAVSLRVVAASGLWAGSADARLNLIEYNRFQQPVSDIAFFSLVDSTFQLPQFERGGWRRAVPLISPRITAGSAFYVLYEVYNLACDSTDRYDLTAAYEIIDREQNSAAVIAMPERNYSGTDRTAVIVERVHTMDLRPGQYLLVVKATDRAGGRRLSATAPFTIIPRR